MTIPASGGIVSYEDSVIISLYYTAYAYEIRCQVDINIDEENYSVTPDSLRIPLSGAMQPITITSQYSLSNYDRVFGTYGELVSFNRVSDKEISVIYQISDNSGEDRYDQPLLTSSKEWSKPIPLTNIYQGRYLDVTTGGLTNVPATSGVFIVQIDSNIEWTISSNECLVGKDDIEQIWTKSMDGSGDAGVFVKYGE